MVTTAGRLLERDRELEQIATVLDGAHDGTGAVIVVEGPAGIGKTRLSRAARQQAEERGFLALAACGADLEREFPFGVVRQLLEPTVRRAAPGDRARMLDGAAALAAPVILPEEAFDSIEPDPTFGVLHGLYWLCANLAEERPLLLVVDDVPSADGPSLRFLGYLSNRVETLSVVVLATRRTGTPDELDIDGTAPTRISLEPLSADAVASFIRLHANGDVDPGFTAACRIATGGNPFLLDQLVRALVERGVLLESAGPEMVETIGASAVSTAVLARIVRQGPEARSLAAAMSIFGDDTQLAHVAELAGLDEGTAAHAAAALAGAGVLEDARPLRFEHPLVRDAVGASLSAGERERLHRRAAALLARVGASAAEVAVHLLPTDPGDGNPVVVATLAEAAREADARGASATAIALLARAVAEPPPTDGRVHLLLSLGRIESSLGRPEAIGHLETAHRLATDPVERGRCALQLGWAHMIDQAEPARVRELIERAIEEVAPVDRELGLELEAVYAAALSVQSPHVAEAAERLERFADLEGRTRAECALLGHLAHIRMDAGRSADDAADLAERVVANDRVVAEVGFDASWLVSSVLVLKHAEHLESALRTLGIALEAARRRGSVAGFAVASVLRASVWRDEGDLDSAEADARSALDAAPARGWLWLPAVATMVDLLVDAGRLDEAESLLTRHDALGELPDVRPATVLILSRATLRAEQGQLQAAHADLEAAQRRLARFTSPSVVGLDGRLRHVLVLHGLGATAEARDVAGDALAVARRWGTPGWIGNALRAQVLVSGGTGSVVGLRQAVASLELSPRRIDYARSLADLGGALRRQGDRVAAREPLRQALTLAHDCGAGALLEHVRKELTATGARVRRDAQTGFDSLTPSERRIVERAAAGATNREIAQALFVTVKTVEMHLGNAYRKLEVSSRSQLIEHLPRAT